MTVCHDSLWVTLQSYRITRKHARRIPHLCHVWCRGHTSQFRQPHILKILPFSSLNKCALLFSPLSLSPSNNHGLSYYARHQSEATFASSIPRKDCPTHSNNNLRHCIFEPASLAQDQRFWSELSSPHTTSSFCTSSPIHQIIVTKANMGASSQLFLAIFWNGIELLFLANKKGSFHRYLDIPILVFDCSFLLWMTVDHMVSTRHLDRWSLDSYRWKPLSDAMAAFCFIVV